MTAQGDITPPLLPEKFDDNQNYLTNSLVQLPGNTCPSQVDAEGVEHVVAHVSRITKAERNYCITRKELLAVVTFLQYFQQYLLE